MYEALKSALLRLLKVPPEPLDPMGDVQSLRVFRAAPGYLRYITVIWLVSQISVLAGGLIALVTAFVASTADGLAATVVMILALLAGLVLLAQATITFFLLRLNYEMRWYKVTDRSLRIRTGVWSVHEMTMTFANIQNITITQGPLERLCAISNVQVETAGGGGSAGGHAKGGGLDPNLHVGVFRGVDNPEEIRGLMLERLRRLRDTGLGDVDEAPQGGAPQDDGEIVSLLAALRDEARALRRTVETRGADVDSRNSR